MKRPSVLALLLGLLVLLSGCAQEIVEEAPPLQEPVGVKLDVQRVERGDLFKLTVYDGEVVPFVEGFSFSMDGIFEAIEVMPGESVQAGDILARMDESALQKQYDSLADEIAYDEKINALDNASASLDLDVARLELERCLARYAQSNGDADRQAVLQQRAAVEKLELSIRQTAETQTLALSSKRERLEGLGQNLGKNVIVAPFAGRVVYIATKQKGDRALASEYMVFLADDTRLSLQSAYIGQSELRSAGAIYARIGDTDYDVQLNEVDMSEYISRMLAGASMELTYEFIEAPEGLTSGQYAAIYIETGRVEDVLYIPSNALYSDAAGRYVYQVVDGARERCPVTVGGGNGIQTIITGGLEEGDYVYVKE